MWSISVGCDGDEKGWTGCRKKPYQTTCAWIFSIKPPLFKWPVGYQHHRQEAERWHFFRKGLSIITEYIWNDIGLWWSSINFSRSFALLWSGCTNTRCHPCWDHLAGFIPAVQSMPIKRLCGMVRFAVCCWPSSVFCDATHIIPAVLIRFPEPVMMWAAGRPAVTGPFLNGRLLKSAISKEWIS